MELTYIFRYPNEQICEGTEVCTGTWFATPWTECTETCGGGTHTREVRISGNYLKINIKINIITPDNYLLPNYT